MTSIEVTAPVPVIDAGSPAFNGGVTSVLETPSVERIVAAAQRNRQRLWRYSTTSILALAISEVVLLVLNLANMPAYLAAIVANLAGTVPSYLMSRYWIWPEADRRRTGRQVALYWATSVVTMLVSSGVLSAVADHAPHHRTARLVVLGTAYLITSFALWIAKFVAYQKVIFPVAQRRSALAETD